MLKPKVEADLTNIFPLGESGYMRSQPSHIEQRVTCSEPGPRNDFGKPKLLATITPDGLQVWCKYCRSGHLITREQCLKAWERGESVVPCEHAQA